MLVVTVVGARPQFIKAAAVSRAIQKLGGIQEVLIHTGQHYDHGMSDVFFYELGIPEPAVNLGIGSGRHGWQTGQMLAAIEDTLTRFLPDCVLVYGDTNSTLAGALSATKLHIPVAHVEAGLRSFNRRMPEEVNRVLTDHTSDLLFAPTRTAVENLAKEGIAGDKVHLVGDVMYDAALHFGKKAEKCSSILTQLDLKKNNYILATIHRAENTDDPARLNTIFHALRKIATHIPVVLPLHPRTRAVLKQSLQFDEVTGSLRLIDPVGYLDMVMLERNAALITTDSGGVQKEAYFYEVPCVTLRDETEWTELVKLGWNRLAPPHSVEVILTSIEEALSAGPGAMDSPYGSGNASMHIVDIIRHRL